MNAYVFKIGSYFDETSDYEGVKLKSSVDTNLKMISGLLARSPGHWAVLIIGIIVVVGILVFLSIYGYKLRHKKDRSDSDVKPLLKNDEAGKSSGSSGCEHLWTRGVIIKLVVCGTLIVVNLIVLICFLFTSSSTFK